MKDWKHRITCGEGRWYHGNLDMGSPVAKIRFVAHKVLEAFRAHLREHNENHGGDTLASGSSVAATSCRFSAVHQRRRRSAPT